MNRKQQITNLRNRISQDQTTLSELKAAEERQDPDEFYPGSADPSGDLTSEDLDDILKHI
ncbi:hypothetical protein ACNQGP_07215 [Flavobacterium sp. GT2N3]|uniref:hypothetical protein n=1 Tax=unclassified Flavobacterium TaxID=196869 RepID=UPI003AAECCE6